MKNTFILSLNNIIKKFPGTTIYGFDKDELMVINNDGKCIAQYVNRNNNYVDVNDANCVNHRSPEDAVGDSIDDIIEVRYGAYDNVFIINKIENYYSVWIGEDFDNTETEGSSISGTLDDILSELKIIFE